MHSHASNKMITAIDFKRRSAGFGFSLNADELRPIHN